MKLQLVLMRAALAWAVALAVGPRAGAAESGEAKNALSPRDEQYIARTTALVFDRNHYAGERFDDTVSQRFFDEYLKALDPSRLYFFESDLAEFAPYRTALDDLTLATGETTPCHRIFGRYLQRVAERVEFARRLLASEKFEFSGSELWRADRAKVPRPRDAAEARQLWRESLRHEYLQEQLAGKKPEEIVKTLDRRYDRMLRTMQGMRRDEVFEMYLNGLAHAYDPHSDYMAPAQVEDFTIQMNLKLFGIGAVLQSDDGYCKIRELMAGGPAARSGKFSPGDRIVAVAQGGEEPVDIIDMPLRKAVELIRGPKDTRVRLTLIPARAADDSVRETVTLVRDEIKVEEQEAKARIVDMHSGAGTVRLGVIDLPAFYADMGARGKDGRKSAARDVARLIRKLETEGVAGLILDLRRNGGGSLDEAIDLAGLFIDRGPVVQTKDAAGRVQIGLDSNRGALYGGPLLVLTSRLSASASEIVAGALQDYGRALIVGDSSTFGKGTVQSMVPLADVMQRNGMAPETDPGSLKLTIAKFYRPGGSSTQLRGVVPDIVLPSLTDVAKIAESELDNAIVWDAVAPAAYQPLNMVGPYLPALREKSGQRVEGSREFAWLREDVETLKRRITDPVASLNLDARMKEKAETEARTEARKQERTKLPPEAAVEYVIKVETADRPGLPAPEKKDAAKAAAEKAADDDDESLVESGAGGGTDPVLVEARHILLDYIALGREPAPRSIANLRDAAPLAGPAR